MRNPSFGTRWIRSSMRRRRRLYNGSVMMRLSVRDSAPVAGAIAILLSLRIIRKLVPEWPMLLRASNAIPPGSDPSPMTATTLCRCP